LRQTLTALRAQRERDGIGLTVAEVDRADLALVNIEYEALELANAGDLDGAARLIDSEEYARLVRIHEKGIQAVSRSAAGYVRATQARIKRHRLWLTMLNGGFARTGISRLVQFRPAGAALGRPARHGARHRRTGDGAVARQAGRTRATQ
jgi:hypothetical protein